MGFTPFYDEEGEYHRHDPNTRSFEYECSNGHIFKIRKPVECPNESCDYGKDSNSQQLHLNEIPTSPQETLSDPPGDDTPNPRGNPGPVGDLRREDL